MPYAQLDTNHIHFHNYKSDQKCLDDINNAIIVVNSHCVLTNQ